MAAASKKSSAGKAPAKVSASPGAKEVKAGKATGPGALAKDDHADHDDHLDGCDVDIVDLTPDEDLPAARGGIAGRS